MRPTGGQTATDLRLFPARIRKSYPRLCQSMPQELRKSVGRKVGTAFTKSSEMARFRHFPLDDGDPYGRGKVAQNLAQIRHFWCVAGRPLYPRAVHIERTISPISGPWNQVCGRVRQCLMGPVAHDYGTLRRPRQLSRTASWLEPKPDQGICVSDGKVPIADGQLSSSCRKKRPLARSVAQPRCYAASALQPRPWRGRHRQDLVNCAVLTRCSAGGLRSVVERRGRVDLA